MTTIKTTDDARSLGSIALERDARATTGRAAAASGAGG
jgi:hypothetical protein